MRHSSSSLDMEPVALKGQRVILTKVGFAISFLALVLALPSRGEAQRTVCTSPTQDLCVTFTPFAWAAVNTTVDGLDDEYQLTGSVTLSGAGGFGALTPIEFDLMWNQGFALTTPTDAWGYGAIPSFPATMALFSGVNFFDLNNPVLSQPFLFDESWGAPKTVELADFKLFGVLYEDLSGNTSWFPCDIPIIPGQTSSLDGSDGRFRVLTAGFFSMFFQAPTDPDCFESLNVVPEPMTVVLLATGLLAIGGAVRRRGGVEIEDEEEEATAD